MLWGFPLQPVGTGTILSPVTPLASSFPTHRQFPPAHMLWLSGALSRAPDLPLCTVLSSLVLCPANSSCPGLPAPALPCGETAGLCWVSTLCTIASKLSAGNLGNWRSHLFRNLRRPVLRCPASWKPSSHVLSVHLVVIVRNVNWFLLLHLGWNPPWVHSLVLWYRGVH